MIEGITVGFIFSLTLFPGTVWLVKVGVHGTRRQVFMVGLAFWLSNLVWLIVAVPGLMMMYRHLSVIRFGMHIFASFVLIYMAFAFFRGKRVDRINDAADLPTTGVLFSSSLKRSLAMPMRLPAAMAILLATGAYINHPPEWQSIPMIFAGVLLGVTWWWGQFGFLSAFFAKRVPEPITIRSLNKIRPLLSVLCLCLAGMVLFLGL